jgi:adenylate kinase
MGLGCLGLNELSLSHGLLDASKPDGDVDIRKLRSLVRKEVSGRVVVFGHLVPYALEPRAVSKVAVLRCEPGVLRGRLAERGYPPRKLVDNVEAELIGLVSSEAYEAFGGTRTFEIDTTHSTPAQAAQVAIGILRGTRAAPPRIDWTTSYDSAAKLRFLLTPGE